MTRMRGGRGGRKLCALRPGGALPACHPSPATGSPVVANSPRHLAPAPLPAADELRGAHVRCPAREGARDGR